MSSANAAVSLPSLAAIERHRRELLAFQAWQQTGPLSETLEANEDPTDVLDPTARRINEAISASPESLS